MKRSLSGSGTMEMEGHKRLNLLDNLSDSVFDRALDIVAQETPSFLDYLYKEINSFHEDFSYSPSHIHMHPKILHQLLATCVSPSICFSNTPQDYGTPMFMGMKLIKNPNLPEDTIIIGSNNHGKSAIIMSDQESHPAMLRRSRLPSFIMVKLSK